MDITIDMVRGLEPPPIYNYEPKEYTLHNVSKDTLKRMCPKIKEMIVLGCTVDGHIIYIRNDLPKGVYDIILRHEKAHVNGWHHGSLKLQELVRKLKGQ